MQMQIWNRGWNGLFKLMERPVNSVDIPDYIRQLNSFLLKSYNSESEKLKIMAEFLKELNDFEKVKKNDSDLNSLREVKKNRKFIKNRYDRFEKNGTESYFLSR